MYGRLKEVSLAHSVTFVFAVGCNAGALYCCMTSGGAVQNASVTAVFILIKMQRIKPDAKNQKAFLVNGEAWEKDCWLEKGCLLAGRPPRGVKFS